MKLLIVDDSKLALKLLADQLALLDGVDELAQAENGEEAVKLLERQPFDLVITDLVMPGLTGMDVLATAGRLQPGCLVIVLTGLCQRGCRRGRNAGRGFRLCGEAG